MGTVKVKFKTTDYEVKGWETISDPIQQVTINFVGQPDIVLTGVEYVPDMDYKDSVGIETFVFDKLDKKDKGEL